MTKATYVDANVLICAFRGDAVASDAASAVLGDAGRTLVTSEYLQLETRFCPLYAWREGRDELSAAPRRRDADMRAVP
jgi:predicted nucleic acid-binding protein